MLQFLAREPQMNEAQKARVQELVEELDSLVAHTAMCGWGLSCSKRPPFC